MVPFLIQTALLLDGCSSAGGDPVETAPVAPASPGGGQEKPETATAETPPPVIDDSPPPALAADGSKADRPAPNADKRVRECGRAIGTAKPLRISKAIPRVNSVTLGAAFLNGAPSSQRWVEGSPELLGNGLTGSGTVGPDLNLAGGLSAATELGNQQRDNFQVHVGDKSALQLWVDATQPSAKRLSYGGSVAHRSMGWSLASETRMASAPNDKASLFVFHIPASRFAAFQMTATFPDDCAVGAVADILGVPAILRNPKLGNRPGLADSIFDDAKRAEIQRLLIREGVELRVDVLSNKAWSVVDSLLGATKCSPSDLGACAALTDALQSSLSAAPGAMGVAATIFADKDPTWSVSEFSVRSMFSVP